MVKHLQKLFALVLVCCALLGSSTAWGQVSIQKGSTVSQNFNSIGTSSAATLPDNWKVSKSTSMRDVTSYTNAVSATERSGGSNLATSAGNGIYNFEASASADDRAIGFLSSGSATKSGNLYAHFINTGSTNLSRIGVSYDVEKYRQGSRTEGFSIELYYSFDGTTWTSAGESFKASFPGDADNTGYEVAPGVTKNGINQVLEIEVPVNGNLYLAWNYSATTGTGSSNAQALAIDNIEVVFEPAAPTDPAIKTGVNSIDLGENLANSTFSGEYKLSAVNIAEGKEVTVTADAPFEVSTSMLEGFASTLTFTGSQLETDKTIYVRVKPTTIGEVTGKITHTAEGANDVVVNVKAVAVSPYTQNFNNCGTTIPGGWMAYSVTGDQVWECTTYGRSNNAVQINGYASGSKNNEDWLISPALDLTGFNIPLLSFWTRSAFVGPGLKVMVSTNYDGTSAPATATWTELDIALPAVNSDVWTQSEFLLDQYKQASVHVAIVYTSVEENNGSSRWTFDDFSVTDEPYKFIADNASFDFGALAQGNFSEAKYITFKALGFTEDIVISSNLIDFEVSKDNVTYAQSVTYTAEEAAKGDELFVRFLPKSTALRFEGKVTATSGDDFVMELGTLTGSSILKNTTLDVVTWNMEWFGADKDKDGRELGPDNEELQYANAKKVFSDLDADILALQEVSNDDEIQRLAGELGYEYVASSAYSYSWDETSTLTPQKLYFLYKPEIAKVKKEKVLLEKFYTDARKGQYASEFTSYPEGASKFWSSGRLPFMVEFETTVNNVKQDITLINLHTRANSGTNVDKHTQRKFDVEMLKDSLDAYYAGKNIIILGDYNDDVDVSVVNNLPSTFKAFVDDEDYDALTYDLSLTGAYTYASGQYESFLDHMIVTSTLSDDYITESVTIEDQFLNSISNFRSTSSDHMPVSARFNLSATPAVSFTEATATKAEDAGKYNVSLTLSEAQATEQTVTVSVLAGGSASAADYTVTGAEDGEVTVTVPANATTATFEVEITDDNLVEANEQVVFMITGKSANLIIGEESTYTLTITDNDKSAVNFTAAALEINEESGLTEVTLELDQATVAEEQITISVTNGTGVTYGTDGDYTTTPAVDNNNIVVTVPAGATSVEFDVNIIDDEAAEENEMITFGIASVSNKLMIGTTEPTFALTIERNDVVTGIADATKGQFSVYPNPATNYVNLLLPAKTAKGNVGLSVWSVDGRRVFETTGNLDAVNQNLNSKVSTLANGVYIIKVQAGKEVYQTRLMKN